MVHYLKAIAAILGAVGTWGTTAALDGSISLVECFGLVFVLGTALAVYAAPYVAAHE